MSMTPMNRGAQLLAVHIKAEGSQARLAEKTGVNQGNLSRYASGAWTPGLKTRQILKDKCTIPLDAWDEEVTDTGERSDDTGDEPRAENGSAA